MNLVLSLGLTSHDVKYYFDLHEMLIKCQHSYHDLFDIIFITIMVYFYDTYLLNELLKAFIIYYK
jgi:hypothetical protein